MIDYFALALAHGLLVIALLRLATNDALDHDPADGEDQHGEDRRDKVTGKRNRRRA